MLRYSKLTDEQVLKRLLDVLHLEKVPFNDQGLEALIFTAEGDMRQALNNAQATMAGFGFISTENVFKVCDQPHPILIQKALAAAASADFDGANGIMEELWKDGYCGLDIVGTLFRLAKSAEVHGHRMRTPYQIHSMHVSLCTCLCPCCTASTKNTIGLASRGLCAPPYPWPLCYASNLAPYVPHGLTHPPRRSWVRRCRRKSNWSSSRRLASAICAYWMALIRCYRSPASWPSCVVAPLKPA